MIFFVRLAVCVKTRLCLNSKSVAEEEHGKSVHTPLKTHPRTLLCCKLLSPAPLVYTSPAQKFRRIMYKEEERERERPTIYERPGSAQYRSAKNESAAAAAKGVDFLDPCGGHCVQRAHSSSVCVCAEDTECEVSPRRLIHFTTPRKTPSLYFHLLYLASQASHVHKLSPYRLPTPACADV